ncbi:MAG: virginiamycin lyase, partial [Frankiales bacterium]|nr:virginiamycin lyase [Frankiales bacterium]
MALVPALALVATYAVPVQAISPALPNAYDAVTEMATPLNTNPFDIISGPDGNMWYTMPGQDEVVKASTDGTVLASVFLGDGRPSCAPTGITIGPDKNIWVACFAASLGTAGDGLVVRIIPSTLVQRGYRLPGTVASRFVGCSCAEFLTPGPDGYLWLTESGPGYVTKLNVTTGAIHRYPLPAGINADPRGIAVGRDGNLWIAESVANRIGRMTPSGVLTQFAVPTASAQPFGITAGPDGRLFYTEIQGNAIGRITTSGVSTEIHLAGSSSPRLINVGPDGNLWFTEYGTSQIASMTPGGQTHEVATTTATSKPFGIATGPDGNVWWAESNASNVGKVGARHSALYLDKTAIGFGNVNENDTAAAQRITLTNAGAEDLAAFTPSLFGGGPGGDTGSFGLTAETCSAGPIVAGGSCYADVTVVPTLTPGPAVLRLNFLADGSVPTAQSLKAGLAQVISVPTCKSVAISTSSDSPQHVGVTFSLIGGANGCPDANPLYQFWLRSTAGVWSVLQPFGVDNTAQWNTTGYKPGTYLTGVWVKDANSTKQYDAYAFGTFTIDFPSCTSTNMTRDASSPQVIGATVNFTASALGCPNPLFQWWVRNPQGVWTIVVPYAAGNTYAWDTTGHEAGTWQIGIWAKQTGSTKSYDAFAFLTYTLTTAAIGPPINQPCSAVNV